MKSLLLALLLVAAPTAMGVSAAVQKTEAVKPQVQKSDVPEPKTDKPAPAAKQDKKRADKKLTPEERWACMTDEERKVLRDRFEALRKLSPEDRDALKKRARELAKQRHDYEEKLDPKLRKELEGLPPHERDRILRDHQIAEHRRAGEELRESLDEGPRHLVEEMFGHHEGRRRPFHSMRDELRDEFGDKVVKRFGEMGHLTQEEERHLMMLSGRERMVQALAIKRKRIEAMVLQNGLPEGTTDKKWEKMKAEPSVEKFLKQCRKAGFDEHLGMGFHRGRMNGEHSPKSEGPGRNELGPKGPGPGGPGFGGPPKRDQGGERPEQEKPASKEEQEIRELGDRLRPSLADRLAIKDLPFADRRAKMDGLLRKRAEAFLKDRKWFPKKDAKLLKKLTDAEFIEHLQKFVHERRGLDHLPVDKGDREKPRRDRDERKPGEGEGRRGGPGEEGRRPPK